MTAPKTPDTAAIRAFAAGMRNSVGIRRELLAAQSHLLALCDALDAEREANAPKPPPSRAPDVDRTPLSPEELAALRDAYENDAQWPHDMDRDLPLPEEALRLLATLDAERAANAEMRRALENVVGAFSGSGRVMVLAAPGADLEKHVEAGRAALRAAEKAPATTEPAPPAGDGLTAEELMDLVSLLSGMADRYEGLLITDSDTKALYASAHALLPRVRAAADKASAR